MIQAIVNVFDNLLENTTANNTRGGSRLLLARAIWHWAINLWDYDAAL